MKNVAKAVTLALLLSASSSAFAASDNPTGIVGFDNANAATDHNNDANNHDSGSDDHGGSDDSDHGGGDSDGGDHGSGGDKD